MSKKWVNKYRLKGIKPGRIYLPGLGEIDLANEKTPVARVDQAYKRGCQFLELIPPETPDKSITDFQAEEPPKPRSSKKDKPKA